MAFSADYFCCCLYRRPFGRLPRDLSGIGTRACPIALLLYFTVLRAGCHPFAPFYATFLPPCAHCVPVRSLFCYILPFQKPDVIPLRLFTRYFCRLALIVYPSDHSFVIFYRFKSRMSSFCAFLRDIFAALRSLCTRPITLLLYFTILRAGCHPFAPFYTTFLPSCAHSADEADIFWRSSFPPGIDAADALTISGCGMIKVIGFGFSLPTLKAPSEFSGNKPDLPRFLSARKPHRGGRVFCPFLPSFSVLRKTWLQAHGLFYCF